MNELEAKTEPSSTPCKCAGPGWCPRHGCNKSPHLFRLCQYRLDYFQLWEEGRGPAQPKSGNPGLIKKGVGFLSATAQHLMSGLSQVSDVVYESRMEKCRDCSAFSAAETVCRKCGCRLEIKAKWVTGKCPLGKWSEHGDGETADPLSTQSTSGATGSSSYERLDKDPDQSPIQE